MRNDKPIVAITGAAGNLRSILAQSMVNDNVILNLLWYSKEVVSSLVSK